MNRKHAHTSTVPTCTVFLLSLFAASLIHAGTSWPDGILDRATVMKEAASITLQKYPDADDVLVDDVIRVRYEKNGTSETWDDTYVKILTEKGRRENKSLRFYFTIPYSTCEVTLLEVIKPDGAVRKVDVASQSREMIDRSQMSSNIYDPNRKLLQVNIPGLSVGDLVHYVYHKSVTKARVPDTWSDYQVFEYTSPIKRMVYEVNGPASLPLKNIVIKDEKPGAITHQRTQQADRILHTWEVADMPRMFQEPSMPSLHTVVQRLLISTVGNWREISRWYWELSKPHFASTDAMKEKMAELTDGITDRSEKIKSVFTWVSQEIRYLGITVEKEAPGYEPHDASMTFENRHGVCRDKAALLVALLREAGFKAYPVLIYVGPKKDPEVPQPFFNHAISCVENPDGGYTLMDATDETTKELFPAYLCDKSYLVAKPDGEDLLVSPIVPAEENMVEIATAGTVDAKGSVEGTVTITFNGYNDNVYRSYFLRARPEQRKQFFEGAVKKLAAGARMTDLVIKPDDLQDLSVTLSAAIGFAADDVMLQGDTCGMLPVPRLGNRVGIVNFILGKTGLKERKYPLSTEIACGVREELSLTVDPSVAASVEVPDYPEINTDTITWKHELSWDDHTLKGRDLFMIKTVEFSPDEYLELKDQLKTIEYNNRKRVITKTGGDDTVVQNDIIILDHTVDYTLEDRHNWTVAEYIKKKILTYKGMKEHAEVTINYNPVWMEVSITDVRVANGDTVQEIKPEEINIMDAGWVGAAPRYPGGKTLVASLPGVEKGSIVEYKVKVACKDQPFFNMLHVFQDQNPIVRKKVTLTAPEALKLTILKADEGTLHRSGTDKQHPVIDAARTEKAGGITWSWSVSDQKAGKVEESQPPWHTFHPSVLATSGSWKDYAAMVQKHLLKHAEPTAAVKEKTDELLKSCEDTASKLTALRDYAAKNIRAAGPSLPALPFSAISSAETTLADGYGNTADRAVLLYAMLTSAGFSPQLILASNTLRAGELQQLFTGYPVDSIFPVVLLQVADDAGEPCILGDTNQYAHLGTTPHEGCLALRLSDGSCFEITLPENRQTTTKLSYDITITDTGDARLSQTTGYFGTGYAAHNKQFSEMTPELRARYFMEKVASIAQSAKPTSPLGTEFAEYPGRVKVNVAIDRYAVIQGDSCYFELPTSLENILPLRSETRSTPLYRRSNSRIQITTRLTLPGAFSDVVLFPDPLDITLPGQSGTITIAMEKESESIIVIRRNVDLSSAVIAPEDYRALLETDRRLSHPKARTVLLQKEKAKQAERP